MSTDTATVLRATAEHQGVGLQFVETAQHGVGHQYVPGTGGTRGDDHSQAELASIGEQASDRVPGKLPDVWTADGGRIGNLVDVIDDEVVPLCGHSA